MEETEWIYTLSMLMSLKEEGSLLNRDEMECLLMLLKEELLNLRLFRTKLCSQMDQD